MNTPRIPLAPADLPDQLIHARYVWRSRDGKLQGSDPLTKIYAEMIAPPQRSQPDVLRPKTVFVFDNVATIRKFADQMHMSQYQADVITVAARTKYFAHEVVALAELIRFGYGDVQFNRNADLDAIYEHVFGSRDNPSDFAKIESVYHEIAVDNTKAHDPISGFAARAFAEMYSMQWLQSMMSAKNTKWSHAKNMQATSVLIELWNTVSYTSGYGLTQAVNSGIGIELVRESHSGWIVVNRPKKIITDNGMLVVPRNPASPSDRFLSVVGLMSPTLNDNDEIVVRAVWDQIKRTSAGRSLQLIMPSTFDPRYEGAIVCLPLPYLPIPFRKSSQGNGHQTLPKVVASPKIKVLLGASRAEQAEVKS
jgi:hypothetical protein